MNNDLMKDSDSRDAVKGEPKTTLQEMHVHASWSSKFRNSETKGFYDAAVRYISKEFGSDRSIEVVDAGCGSGTKSMLLAEHGYKVFGWDFSSAILVEAKAAVTAAGYAERVRFDTVDLTNIAQPTGSIPRIVCWGVMMHIPTVEKSVQELARVLAPGGILVVSENNCRSLQSLGMRGLKALLGKQRAQIVRRPPGVEHWEETPAGKLMTRHTDVCWMIAEFERQGLRLTTRRAGQFTELFTMMPFKPLRLMIHWFNALWFHGIRWGGPAFGNLLVFRKPK